MFTTLTIATVLGLTALAKPFPFFGENFVHRYSRGNLHEFTPTDQPDLEKWTTMLTVNRYPTAKTGEELARIANNVLGAYQDNGGKVLRTASTRRTAKKPAEHLIVIAFVRSEFSEVAFTRFWLSQNRGVSLAYSRRFTGEDSARKLDEWVKANGAKLEKSLMAVKTVPSGK